MGLQLNSLYISCVILDILLYGILIEVILVKRKKEANVLFNDVLNTFYLRLYGLRHMVKDHSDIERKPAAATWATLFD